MAATMFTSLRVGKHGSALTQILKGSFTVDVPSIAAAAVAELTVTVAGLTTSDVVAINPPAALETGLQVGAVRVSAANTLKFRVSNHSAGAVDAASATYAYTAVR
jgi:hypothetical protein